MTNKDQELAPGWGVWGNDWLKILVKDGLVKDVAPNCGYPHVYSSKAKVLIPIIGTGIPQSGSGLIIGGGYMIS